MKYRIFCLLIALGFSQSATADEGLISIKSSLSAAATADKFESIIKSKGFTVFNRIDHQSNASNVDLTLMPSTVVIFGNPKVGSQLMQCAPSVAIDLPQKALFWEDAAKQVWLSYNDPAYLQKRHHIEGCDAVMAKISNALKNLSQAATKK